MNKNVFIAPGAVVLGDVEIGENSSVWFNAVVRTEEGHIKIGDNTNIQDNCTLHTDVDADIDIGDNVTIGHGAIVHGCTIGDNTLVGMGAIILNHAKIGNHCIIGAGALVTEGTEIPDGSLVIGSPAKVKRYVTEEEKSQILENALHYVKSIQNYK